VESSHDFSFRLWGSGVVSRVFRVGTTGSIRFGTPPNDHPDPYGHNEGGVSIGRFDPLAEAASTLIDSAPAICVFFKPRMSGPHYAKELADRVVITWDLTEPFGNIQDFTWFKTTNRFQAVLDRDGSIEMSYQELATKDAIVGLYPAPEGGEKPLEAISAEPHPALAAHLDVRSLKLSVDDSVLLKVRLEMRGPVLPEGDTAIDGIAYRIVFDAGQSLHQNAGSAPSTFAWKVRGLRGVIARQDTLHSVGEFCAKSG
jgi:hypothetical protein